MPFQLARFFYEIAFFHESLQYYARSEQLFGRHYLTLYHKGLSLYATGQLQCAQHAFTESLAAEPEFAAAFTWRNRVRRELQLLLKVKVKSNNKQKTTTTTDHKLVGVKTHT